MQEQQLKYSNLDAEPTLMHTGTTAEKIMKLRPREPEKELGPPSFRFQNNSTMERVYESLLSRTKKNMDDKQVVN